MIAAAVRVGVGVRRTYVLARDERAFLIWVKTYGQKLQDCNFVNLMGAEGIAGIHFTDPTVELQVIVGWETSKDDNAIQAGCVLIARYCLEKRVRVAPTCNL